MREAGRVTAKALAAVRELIRPGVTTAELNAAAEEIIRKSGGFPTFLKYPGPYPYPATICVSINEELVHGIPGKRKLRIGDVVSVDCGTTLDGFVGDAAITVGVGEVSSLAQRLIETTRQSLYDEKDGFGPRFKAQLDLFASEESFPEGWVSGLFGARARFKGPQKLSKALEDYRQKLRDLASFSNAERGLTALIDELRLVSIGRKLVAEHAAKFVFDAYRTGVENIAMRKEIWACNTI